MTRIPVTLSIVAGGVLVTAGLSIGLGMLAAVRGGWADRVVQMLSVVGMARPTSG